MGWRDSLAKSLGRKQLEAGESKRGSSAPTDNMDTMDNMPGQLNFVHSVNYVRNSPVLLSSQTLPQVQQESLVASASHDNYEADPMRRQNCANYRPGIGDSTHAQSSYAIADNYQLLSSLTKESSCHETQPWPQQKYDEVFVNHFSIASGQSLDLPQTKTWDEIIAQGQNTSGQHEFSSQKSCVLHYGVCELEVDHGIICLECQAGDTRQPNMCTIPNCIMWRFK